MFNDLRETVQAYKDRDPAARSTMEILLLYPGLKATQSHKAAHWCYEHDLKFLARFISQRSRHHTGIEIHPGAKIGKRLVIDHGMGVVIGETAIIGRNVTLYQGVTLGAKSFRYDKDGKPLNLPRHPILEDDVTVYSNASILGRITIGKGAVIGGNVWLTHSVPPGARVLQGRAEEQFSDGAGI